MANEARVQAFASAPPFAPVLRRQGTVYVVAADAITLDVINPRIHKGELPNFARLAERGSHGPLATIWPTESPVVWNSIATGQEPEAHGVDGFQWAKIFGRRVGHRFVRKAKKLGLKLPLKLLMRLGYMTRHLYDARDVRAKRFWEIISEHGGRVAVVNWWHTWPASPLLGFLVSDRLFYWREAAKGYAVPTEHLTYPANLLAEIHDCIVAPDEISADEMRAFVNLPADELAAFMSAQFAHHDLRAELRFLIAADRTYMATFERIVARQDKLALATVCLRGCDIAQHCAFHCMEGVGSRATDEERRKFGNVVPQAYRVLDDFIGRIMELMRPEDTLFVVSDHGFAYDSAHGQSGHSRGCPPGVLYCLGREFAAGREICGASIYDFAPTLLRIFGMPLSAELRGRALEELFDEEHRRANPPLPAVPSYGAPQRSKIGAVADEKVEKTIAEHLRALGYMD